MMKMPTDDNIRGYLKSLAEGNLNEYYGDYGYGPPPQQYYHPGPQAHRSFSQQGRRPYSSYAPKKTLGDKAKTALKWGTGAAIIGAATYHAGERELVGKALEAHKKWNDKRRGVDPESKEKAATAKRTETSNINAMRKALANKLRPVTESLSSRIQKGLTIEDYLSDLQENFTYAHEVGPSYYGGGQQYMPMPPPPPKKPLLSPTAKILLGTAVAAGLTDLATRGSKDPESVSAAIQGVKKAIVKKAASKLSDWTGATITPPGETPPGSKDETHEQRNARMGKNRLRPVTEAKHNPFNFTSDRLSLKKTSQQAVLAPVTEDRPYQGAMQVGPSNAVDGMSLLEAVAHAPVDHSMPKKNPFKFSDKDIQEGKGSGLKLTPEGKAAIVEAKQVEPVDVPSVMLHEEDPFDDSGEDEGFDIFESANEQPVDMSGILAELQDKFNSTRIE